MKQQEIHILFLGGAKRVSFAEHLIAIGREQALSIRIFSYELTSSVPIASVGTVIKGLRWNDPTLIAHLETVTKENHISILLPFVDPAIEIASQIKTLCPNIFIPVSPVEICRTMFDKQHAQIWFEQHQLPVPESFTDLSHADYPLILKPRFGSASKGIEIIYDAEDAIRFEKRGWGLSNYLIQKYIARRIEYTVDCYVMQDGSPWSIVPRIRKETAGGEATVTETVAEPEMVQLSKKILQTGNFRGPVTIQFIRDCETGRLYIMEINPRYGGGVIASFAAGANSLKPLIDESLHRKPQPCGEWQAGVTMSRYFKEVIFYATNH